MRKYLLALALLVAPVVSAQAQMLQAVVAGNPVSAGGGNGYSRPYVIDHTKVPNTDQTNFTGLISETSTYFKTEANGGKVHNASAYDLVLGTDSSCTTRLKWEVKAWSSSTGLVIIWVKIPTVSHTVDTTIYVCYGNTSISTDQSDPANTWNSNHKLSLHLEDGTTLSVTDSTGLNSCTNHSATATTGKIGGGAAFVGASNQYIDCGTSVSPTTAITLSAWTSFTALSADQTVIAKGYDGTVVQWELYSTTTDGGTTNYYACKMYSGGYHGVQATTASSASTLHHVVCTFASGVWKIYVDGVLNNSATDTGPPTSTAGILIGSREATVNPHTGKVDEVVVMDTAVSADWVAAEYANQSSPSTFYTAGSENAL